MKPLALAALNYFKCLQGYFNSVLDGKDFTEFGRRVYNLSVSNKIGVSGVPNMISTCFTTDIMKHVRENMIDIEVAGAPTLDEEFWQRVTSRFIEDQFLQNVILMGCDKHLRAKGATVKGVGTYSIEEICAIMLCCQYSESHPDKFSEAGRQLYKDLLQLYRQSIIESIIKCLSTDIMESYV